MMAGQPSARPGYYWVRGIRVERRYIGERPVECVVFAKGSNSATTVPVDPGQMAELRDRLTMRLAELATERLDVQVHGEEQPDGKQDTD